jgi:hypothetical protein
MLISEWVPAGIFHALRAVNAIGGFSAVHQGAINNIIRTTV